ncbi:MAG: SDR family oxidoreductase [Cryomorphaceae bacterium]|jgi:dTDP-4-dehydrorhamnose reductase|nr:SDR family oxidoreductase [Cryomorphaceae bacterium]
MRILITGSNGLLGQKIVAQCLKRKHTFLATSKGINRNPECPNSYFEELDICDQLAIEAVFNQFRPTHVIHTAALTNVDYCELNVEECQEVNVNAVEKLFFACLRENIHFCLLSTDFVFDGLKGNYSETDEVGPLSVYARSKVDAEKILLSSSIENWSIVRTIIVYGSGNNLSRSNIVLWARESLRDGKELNIVDDQFRAPTFADDLAWACLEICRRDKMGIFHISGPQTMSVFELVKRIADYYGYNTQNLFPSKSATLNQPAKRPPRTGFDLSKARKELGYEPQTLEETLDLF